jgi:hypothetical protein
MTSHLKPRRVLHRLKDGSVKEYIYPRERNKGSEKIRLAVPFLGFYAFMFKRAEAAAKRRDIAWRLTTDDEKRLIIRANGHCEVTGVAFDVGLRKADGRCPFAPSLDRIDSKGIYELNNCRLVCYATNIALFNFGDDILTSLARGMMRRAKGEP